MDAIKKVFKHGDDSNTSPSGHFKTTDESTSHSASHPSNTPNHQSPSAPAKAVEKMAGVDPSHAAGARTDHHSGDSTGTHIAGSRDTPLHNNPASSTSNGLDGERSGHGLTGSSHDHSSSHQQGGLVGKAERAVEQHAAPPAHGHQLPKEHTHLDQAHAKEATHDHKHLAPVTREFYAEVVRVSLTVLFHADEKHQHHETEEVVRQREVDNHIHHVQVRFRSSLPSPSCC